MTTSRIMIYIALCLINVCLTRGEENKTNNETIDNQQPSTVASIVENTKDVYTNIPLQPTEIGENIESSIDRSSYFHHLHEEDLYHHHHHAPQYQGFWKKKFVWRPRWVKTWQEKKVYVAVWKRMWGPATINEWVPIPKPPPGWFRPAPGGLAVHTHPY